MEVGTLKINEIERLPLPPFYRLLEQDLSPATLQAIRKLECPLPDVIPGFLRGGYPEPTLSGDDFTRAAWMENYFRTYVERDMRKLFPRLDAVRYRRFVTMLSSLSGTVINKAQLGRSIDVSEVTIRDYLEMADRTFFWRIIPSFLDARTGSVVKSPKGRGVQATGVTRWDYYHFRTRNGSRGNRCRPGSG